MVCFSIVDVKAIEKDFRIIKSDANGITLEYEPTSTEFLKVKFGVEEFYRFRGADCYPATEQSLGFPELFMRALPIRLMGADGNSVEVMNLEYEEMQNILLQPVPTFQQSDVGMSPLFEMKKDAYSQNSFLPEKVVELKNVGETRGVILGNLLFSPFQYNPATRTVKKITRLVVRVNFGASDAVSQHPDELVEGIAINQKELQSVPRVVKSVRTSSLQNSLLASGMWFKFSINESGMYKLQGSTLLATGIPAGTNPINIKLYNNGGEELPVSVTANVMDDLNEVAIYTFDATSNNTLDADDYVLFYGKGVRGWKYNEGTKTFSHFLNHFTESNVYWLRVDDSPSKQMSPLTFSTQPVEYQPATINAKLYREDEKINVTNSGLEWLGQQFNFGESITYIHPLSGLDGSKPIVYKFRVGAQALGYSNFTIYEHSDVILTTPLIYPTNIARYGPYFVGTYPAVLTDSVMPNFSDDQSRIRFAFTSDDRNGYGFLDSYEIFYQQFPKAQGNSLAFHTHDVSAVTQYKIPGFTTNQVFLFDASRYDSVLINTNPNLTVDTCSFTLQLTSGSSREIFAVGKNSFLSVGPLTRVNNQNLHGDTTEADEIIVTNSEFMSAAERLKTHRERPGSEYLKTLIVDIEKIYNEFGGGLPSPYAIRNYIKYCYNNWIKKPKYLLLFGDGDFDYRGILTQRANKIPVWETGTEFDPINSYTTDDDFVIFNSSNRVALGVGRIPSRTLSEANAVVDKIIEYETHPVQDLWKLRLTLVADDGWTPEHGDREGFQHAENIRDISDIVPQLFQTKKIFLHEYPIVFTANGRRKPAVNETIRNYINQGTLIVNFAGHGNPRLWTHEQVFVRETDFPLLSNKGKYFFLIAATCNYSAIDLLNEQSSGEVLVLLPNAGAIATYSATRPVYAPENFDLNTTLYNKLFEKNSSGQTIPRRFGDIIFHTRQNQTGVNDRKYVLLGDPAVRIAIPRLLASIDSINGVPSSQTAQLQALSNSSLRATVRDTTKSIINIYDGTAQVVVFDAERTVRIVQEGFEPLDYKTDGNVIFRGEAKIDSGKLTTQFIVPKDISYTNEQGRVTVYFSDGTTDGAGFTTNVRIGGTDTTAGNDTEGPAIRLFLDRRTFRSGDVVSATPLLIADLEDEHGINTSGAGIGHRIESWLDENPQSADLTAFYKSNLNTYQEGAVEYSLGALTPGTHKIRLRAWDTYNNASTSETVFDVVNSVGLRLTSVFNYPNPFSSSTIFSIEHNQYESVDAEVKIYTVAGRLIQSLEQNNVNNQIINMTWDGRDRDGDEIANGIYLYKVIVTTSDRRLTGEAYGKLSVLR
ncbi:MAG: type IX secretion system sortase PorU [Ignavibacteriae bacterium]|nr:type IX secretion system sortase PorU [Ignavibacteriota bacterium]